MCQFGVPETKKLTLLESHLNYDGEQHKGKQDVMYTCMECDYF